ncbi:MAG: RNA polymerase sigma factor [Verrucomicrobiota bacterium]
MAESDPADDQWSTWFHDYGPRLLLFARQQTRSESDAQDVLQDAIVRLWKSADKQQESSPSIPDLPLVYRAIRHAAIDLGRKTDRRVRREQSSDYVIDDEREKVEWFGGSNLEEEERNAALEVELQKLPDKFREVLVLKIWGDQTFAQIAESLDISQNTAASRYRYGMEALRKSLKPEQFSF